MLKSNFQPQQQPARMASTVDQEQMNKYCAYVTMLADPSCKDHLKLKVLQEISENCEVNESYILS